MKCDYITIPATIGELCCVRLCWALCHRLWSITLTELSCVRLWLWWPVSELGYAVLCMTVALIALYVYWAVLLQSLLCVIYSVEMGFVIGHYFHSSFLVHFQPNFFTFFHRYSFLFLCLSLSCFITLMTIWQGHNSIGIGIGLPTLNIGCQTATRSLGYRVPKTVHLWLEYC